MTAESEFPIGYFYVVSKMNGMVLDLRGDPETAGVKTKIVMARKKEASPERDSQLWIHQSGILTNKATGLFLDVNTAESFIAIFTGEKRLYLDGMKEQDAVPFLFILKTTRNFQVDSSKRLSHVDALRDIIVESTNMDLVTSSLLD